MLLAKLAPLLLISISFSTFSLLVFRHLVTPFPLMISVTNHLFCWRFFVAFNPVADFEVNSSDDAFGDTSVVSGDDFVSTTVFDFFLDFFADFFSRTSSCDEIDAFGDCGAVSDDNFGDIDISDCVVDVLATSSSFGLDNFSVNLVLSLASCDQESTDCSLSWLVHYFLVKVLVQPERSILYPALVRFLRKSGLWRPVISEVQ